MACPGLEIKSPSVVKILRATIDGVESGGIEVCDLEVYHTDDGEECIGYQNVAETGDWRYEVDLLIMSVCWFFREWLPDTKTDKKRAKQSWPAHLEEQGDEDMGVQQKINTHPFFIRPEEHCKYYTSRRHNQ